MFVPGNELGNHCHRLGGVKLKFKKNIFFYLCKLSFVLGCVLSYLVSFVLSLVLRFVLSFVMSFVLSL